MKLDRLRPHIKWSGPAPEPWTCREATWALLAFAEALIIFGLVWERVI